MLGIIPLAPPPPSRFPPLRFGKIATHRGASTECIQVAHAGAILAVYFCEGHGPAAAMSNPLTMCDDESNVPTLDSVLPTHPPTVPLVTWTAHHVLLHHYERLSVADKRQIFAVMREIGAAREAEHLYLPRYGMTLGEFSILHIVSDHMRRVHRDRHRAQKSSTLKQ